MWTTVGCGEVSDGDAVAVRVVELPDGSATEQREVTTTLPIAGMIESCGQVEATEKVVRVMERFLADPDLEAVAVTEKERPVGLVTRGKLLMRMSRRYAMELYGRETIASIADMAPLTVSRSDSLSRVIEQAFARDPSCTYDEIVVVDHEGRFAGLLSVKRLVAEQGRILSLSMTKAEMERERSRELERLSKLKDRFLAMVTHELRSPLNALVGLIELATAAMETGRTDLLRERLALMHGTTGNLRRIVNQMLDLSKLEAGRMEVSHERVELIPLLDEVAAMTRVLVGDKPVEVAVQTPDEPVVISSDGTKIRQILTNLAGNAAKFTDQGKIALTLREDAVGVFLSVSDSGIGIREEDRELIFSPFGQVEDASTRSREGTGLGLPISRSLARLLGGELTVESRVGVGSTFTLVLPTNKTKQEQST